MNTFTLKQLTIGEVKAMLSPFRYDKETRVPVGFTSPSVYVDDHNALAFVPAADVLLQDMYCELRDCEDRVFDCPGSSYGDDTISVNLDTLLWIAYPDETGEPVTSLLMHFMVNCIHSYVLRT